MYTAKIKLNNNEFEGTLTFSTIKNIQETMKNEFDKNVDVKELIEGLANFDMTLFTVFILETIYSTNKHTKEEVLKAFTDDINLADKFNNAYAYIYKLINKCLPSKESTDKYESEFEDEDEFEDKNSKWDFEYMEYLWSTVLNRTYFWNSTPKNFFAQLEIHQKINGVKQEVDVEEI